MTKIEELRAEFEAATPGDWRATLEDTGNWIKHGDRVVGWTEFNGQADLIILSHNLMPQLLEAVELLERIDRLHPVGTILVEVVQAREILEKFR